MDARIFMNYYTSIDLNGLLLKAATIDDDTGTTLRIHLLCERLVEAWICACSGNAYVFGDDAKRLRMECSSKIEMAKNFGLPSDICEAIGVINSLRNDIAHNVSKQEIPDSRIQSIAAKTSNHIAKTNEKPLDNCYITIFDENGNEQETVTLKSESSKNRLKLYLIFGEILRHVMLVIAKKHSGKWDNDFSQHQYAITLTKK